MDEIAFGDKKTQPTDAELKKKIGRPYVLIEKVVKALAADYPEIKQEWRYMKSSGWYFFYALKKRRIFYVVPKEGDFVFTVILGEKAAGKIKGGDFPPSIVETVDSAKKYAEGRLCRFTKEGVDVNAILEVLKVKIG